MHSIILLRDFMRGSNVHNTNQEKWFLSRATVRELIFQRCYAKMNEGITDTYTYIFMLPYVLCYVIIIIVMMMT
jgi:hypothetical protein